MHDEGEFQIQDDENESIETNKIGFLNWYSKKLNDTPIVGVIYDQCLHCSIGNSVVIFNERKFPRVIKDSSERSKTGLMIETKTGKIVALKFCFVFLETENKYVFECLSKK